MKIRLNFLFLFVFFSFVFYLSFMGCSSKDRSTSATDSSESDDTSSEDEQSEDDSTYTSFNDASNWQAFDPGANGIGTNPLDGVIDSAFDGRYIYFVSYKNGNTTNAEIYGEFLRYDTEADFNQTTSWSSFDPGAGGLGTDPEGYLAVIYDGRYINFIPDHNGSNKHGEVLRYDTESGFEDILSWSVFDLASIDASLVGYRGAFFDGNRYLYLVPFINTAGVHFNFIKFDTQATFTDPSSWEVYNPESAGVGFDAGNIFRDPVFDGRYAYFLSKTTAEILRLDTEGEFNNASSWSFYDLEDKSISNPPDENPGTFRSAIFDGNYVYFSFSTDDKIVRYDISSDFDSDDSWEILDFNTISSIASFYDGNTNGRGWEYMAFDGRYVYFAPAEYSYFDESGDQMGVDENGNPLNKLYHSQMMRFDSAGDFDSADSWEVFDPRANDVSEDNILSEYGADIGGLAFDGQYIYFPCFRTRTDSATPRVACGEILRFKANTTVQIPSVLTGGSF